jgi:hypothetical protein
MRLFVKAPDNCTTEELVTIRRVLEGIPGAEFVVARDYQELMDWEVTHPYLAKQEAKAHV